MARKREHFRYYVADTESTQPNVFQTTEDKPDISNFIDTHVWICGFLLINSKNYERDVKVRHTIEEMFNDFYKLDKRFTHIIFFHNLAWDVSFILKYLKDNFYIRSYAPRKFEFINYRPVYEKVPDLEKHTFSTMTSIERTWYGLTVKLDNGVKIQFRDSQKLLPLSLDQLSHDINVKYKKKTGTIDYQSDHKSVNDISKADYEYFVYDLYSLAESLFLMNKEDKGLLKCFTIGQFAMSYYKKIVGKKYFRVFPYLSNELDSELRKSYKGGWCYVGSRKKEEQGHGYVCDLNSLYPAVMENNKFPIGEPVIITKDYDYERKDLVYITKVELWNIHLKKNKVPWLQLKQTIFSDNEYIRNLDEPTVFTLTQPDFELLKETYEFDFIQIKTWGFYYNSDIFKEYVNHFMNMKLEAIKVGNASKRLIAKLSANNLYGKMAQSHVAESGLVDFEIDDKAYSLELVSEQVIGGYIPAGSFITAYARGVTIRGANANYNNFVYSDTDSIHIMGKPKNIKMSQSKIGYWKVESEFTRAKYLRQKTYIEYDENLQRDIDNGKYKGKKAPAPLLIKSAGANNEVKKRLQYECSYYKDGHWHFKPLTPETPKRSIDDFFNRFREGLRETGKLRHTDRPSGSILVPTTFTIKGAKKREIG